MERGRLGRHVLTCAPGCKRRHVRVFCRQIGVRRDRYDKKDLYARFGVKEYWIGDPANKSLEILTLKDGRYELYCAAEVQGKLTSLVLPGLEFDLTEIQ